MREMRAFAPESSHGPLCVELLWFLSVILGRPDWEEASRPWWSQGGPHSVGGLGLKIPFESVKAVRAALRYQARVRLFVYSQRVSHRSRSPWMYGQCPLPVRFFKISSVVNQRHLKMAPQNQNSTKKVSDALCKARKGDVAAIAAMAAMACAHSHLNVSSTPIRKSRGKPQKAQPKNGRENTVKTQNRHGRLSPQQSPPSHPREDSPYKLQNQNQRAKYPVRPQQPLSEKTMKNKNRKFPSAKPPITQHQLDLEFDSESD